VIALFLLLSCTPRAEQGNECTPERACDWGATCVEGFCVTTACATSAQCPVETFCEQGQCVVGCRQEADCGPGRTCDLLLQECVDQSCQDTQTDCGFREYCDTNTGTCFDAGEQYCRPCERNSQCGEGNVCFADYCGVDCNDSECPSGFDCLAIRNGFGDVTAYQCITYCWLYE
jgi:Cys-rich repeat protein